VVVDFAGYPSNLEKFRKLADEYGCFLIQDACHAPGAAFKDSEGQWQKAGNGKFADISIFSFHPVKHIATGEGGLVTTNNLSFYKKMALLRTHGITKDPAEFEKESDGGWYYEMQELGYNYRISDLQCSLGLSQLKRIEKNLKQREAIAKHYDHELNSLVQIPVTHSNIDHAYHLYVIQTDKRDELYRYLKDHGIFAQVHYMPVHMHPYYRRRYPGLKFEVAETYYKKALSLPMYHSLTLEDQNIVIAAIKKFFECTR
jgi:dTDP-4-amino-4,6-dideoxygalactose transaminase